MMTSINSLSEDALFKRTSLADTFKKIPLGFIDAGAAGGVHTLVIPIASLVHCTCFEPDPDAYNTLWNNQTEKKIFSGYKIINKALGIKASDSVPIYLTVSRVNSSLLRPRSMLVKRYDVNGFKLEKEVNVPTVTLDMIVCSCENINSRLGEFIKLDCQGAEYDILEGSQKTLEGQCIAIWCEVELFKMYERQKVFSEIDLFLNEKGFRLYGFYPNYISTKKLDRNIYETEERIIWADALYFKDPLSDQNKKRHYTKRELDTLLLTAILTGFYDFALELIAEFYQADLTKDMLIKLIKKQAAHKKDIFVKDFQELLINCTENQENSYILGKKFVDKYSCNNNIDYIKVS